MARALFPPALARGRVWGSSLFLVPALVLALVRVLSLVPGLKQPRRLPQSLGKALGQSVSPFEPCLFLFLLWGLLVALEMESLGPQMIWMQFEIQHLYPGSKRRNSQQPKGHPQRAYPTSIPHQ